MKTETAKPEVVVVNDDATQLMLRNQLLRIGYELADGQLFAGKFRGV